MGSFLVGVVLPLLLLAAALWNWSLICLVDLVAFLLIRFLSPKRGFRFRWRFLLLWSIFIFSLVAILAQVIFLIVWATEDGSWSIEDAWWSKLFGLMPLDSWRSPSVIYFLVLQLSVALVASIEIRGDNSGLFPFQDSCWGRPPLVVEHIGSHLRVASCLLLPAVQLVAGISNPSWVSLPFFICSCVGLVDWSLTSNFLGLFRWWRPLWLYGGFNIFLLYVYQLPLVMPEMLHWVAEFVGLYKISAKPEWPNVCSGVSLIVFYVMVSCVKRDLEEMDFIMSMREGNLTEQLLPSRHSFFIRERFGVRHTNVLLRGPVFRIFSINFFTYGFPITTLFLTTVIFVPLRGWICSFPFRSGRRAPQCFHHGFHFASICAFGLLAYVGYVIYAFPSLFRLHRLNGLLLVFILLWAVSTFIFNVAFAFLNWTRGADTEIWELVGLWHYPIPGFFLLAQFCLGVLVALGNLVNNSVFLYMSDESGRSLNDNCVVEVKEETKVLIVATIAWGLRKCSRATELVLIFLIAMKPGFVHAVYITFFLIYLLSHDISKRIRRSLILLCEAHFAILYILQLNLVSVSLKREGSLTMEILTQLGLLERDSSWDLWEIAVLACLCAVHNHGSEMLFSFSAIVQHAPCLPVGFSILKAGLNKSVLLSIYASPSIVDTHSSSSYEIRIASYLSAIGGKFLSIYRSFGTYVAFLTIIVAVYNVGPNYVSFGYMFLLLVWIIGRQLVEKAKRRLWYPLKVYAIVVFVFIYILSIFPSIKIWLSGKINLSDLGYDTEASLWENVWESMAVMVVMQLYSYERRQSRGMRSDYPDPLRYGLLGFIRRLLIWHSQKILLVALFYASLSPISAPGLLYILGLVIYSNFPKVSRVPSKSFLVYTGFLMIAEYLFQMWGEEAEMFPGQKHYDISLVLGLRKLDPGFWGLEEGLRAKVLVIVACTLQYNVFHWLENVPSSLQNRGRWDEPCPLFFSAKDILPEVSIPYGETSASTDPSGLPTNRTVVTSNSWPSFNFDQVSEHASPHTEASQTGSYRKFSFGYIWGSFKESHKWNRKRVHVLRKERFELQTRSLKIYLKFWMENMFCLFGLEINMIALLLTSFALLNAVSMFYIASLAACILLERRIIRKFWPLFVLMFASILILEYVALWKTLAPFTEQASFGTHVTCHDCWKLSSKYFYYCTKCWFGLTVDDPRTLISYFVVFMFACFKLRADRNSGLSRSFTYHQVLSQRKNTSLWRDLSFETKSMWTFLDYVRLYCYCHLLDLVLALILITGTLEYDILHFGYLGFALVFFRIRLQILKKKNKIFKFLRIYNFSVILLSLAYQSPFLGDFTDGKCDTKDYFYEAIGFYKYAYGFRITSRSALVEIIIFVLVSLQSYMFSSREFDYVFRYLEAEQIGAIVREQEKKAAWKNAQLQHIRKSEEKKRQRNSQVEKMKSEMLNLQIQLHSTDSIGPYGDTSPVSEKLRRRRSTSPFLNINATNRENRDGITNQEPNIDSDMVLPSELYESPTNMRIDSPGSESRSYFRSSPACEIIELEEDANSKNDDSKENPLVSAVQLLGDGVSQVQSLGNQAVSNFVSYLNIPPDDTDTNEQSSGEDILHRETHFNRHGSLDRSSSLQSERSKTMSEAATLQIGRIFNHIWSQMRSNNDVVCYCCFILVFLWNFSVLSMVYLAALFLYALCVNGGPSYIFWVVLLIYTEVYILLQYVYQIIIQHCGFELHSEFLVEMGFPTRKITTSFVIKTLPLFLVYLFTLIQSSITAKDGEWVFSTDNDIFMRRVTFQEKDVLSSSWTNSAMKLLRTVKNVMMMIARSFSIYWKSLTQGAESPPYFVQLSLDVHVWPEDGIQPERIESGINELLRIMHDDRCKEKDPSFRHAASRVHVQSIERSSEDSNVALAVFEVVYASPLTKCTPEGWYKSLTPAADVAKEILQAQKAGIPEQVKFPYPIISVIGGGRRELDLYAYTFGADLAVFFLVAMFYQAVIENKSEFLEVYQLEDQFPKEFVFVLMVVFFLIVVDRIIYLCSFATGKVIFYIFNLVLFTYSITQYAWNMEGRHLQAGGFALRAIYLTKSVSLALQAIQIRYGVPHKSTLYRQFLTSKVSRVNYLGYRVYRALPFLYELRCVLDWSCTTTSLTMYDWLKLEDINASLYLVKCDAILNRATHKQGERQSKMTKFCNGICLFFVLICIIWLPMLMYSSGNPTNIANPIKDATVQLDIKTEGGRLPLFQTTLCETIPWDYLNDAAVLDPRRYLDTYDKSDIQLICCQPDASTLWLVPDVVLSRYVRSINENLTFIFTWVLTRDRPKGKELVKYENIIDSSYNFDPSEVKDVLKGSANSFLMNSTYSRYFRVTGSGDVRTFEPEENVVPAELVLNRGSREWWSFQDISEENATVCGGLAGPMAIVVSEETPQGLIGETLSKFSIWGLYITFVLAVGRFIRLQCSDLRMRIPYENLPSCDRLIAICEDIYAARAEGELGIEEVLYWTLIKIYRSPHMLLEYTKAD